MTMMSDDVDDDGDSDANDANNNDGNNGDNNDGEVEHDGGDDNDDNNDDDNVNIDVVEDDNNDGMTTMRWRQGQKDDDDEMAMGGQQHTECLQAPRHPSEATINLCRQFGEELTRERDNFGGGGAIEKCRRGGDLVDIKSKPNKKIQNNQTATPVQKKDRNLFRMCPGREATILAPW